MFFSFGKNICPLLPPKFSLSITTKLKPKQFYVSTTCNTASWTPWNQAVTLKISLKLNSYCKTPVMWDPGKSFICFHYHILFIFPTLVWKIYCLNSFHKSLLILAESLDITEGRGILVLILITPTESAGAVQQQELCTRSQKLFVLTFQIWRPHS